MVEVGSEFNDGNIPVELKKVGSILNVIYYQAIQTNGK